MLSGSMLTETDSPLDRAKEQLGGAAGIASKLSERDPDRKLTAQAVSQWKRVPADRCLDIAALTGISVHELRPDVFGAKQGEAA